MTIAIAASRTDRNSLATNRTVPKPAHRAPRDVPFGRTQLAGRLSLLDTGPLKIAAVRGLIVRVRSGALWITQYEDPQDYVLRAGESFVVDRAGPLVVSAFGTTEVHVDWPSGGIERLSPGLEPIEATV